MSETDHILKETVTIGREQAAERLRALADMLDAGAFVDGAEPLEIPEEIVYELDVERKEKHGEMRFEIEAEVHWRQPVER